MIGLFDSGLGGLAIWREVDARLPRADILYLSDSGAFPYGHRHPDFVRSRAEAITRELIRRGCSLVVVACNTATVTSIRALREAFPIPFVGVVPPVKVAAQHGAGPILALTTANTAAGRKYMELLEAHAPGRAVTGVSLDLLARIVEDGSYRDPEVAEAAARAILERSGPLEPGTQVVLGCTHYTFLRRVLETRLGAPVVVIDPAPAVAEQVLRLVRQHGIAEAEAGRREFLCTGDTPSMQRFLREVVGVEGAAVQRVEV
ncbi:glutamate racemase [bacterium]|nr:glutamate racemase [bacterium]